MERLPSPHCMPPETMSLRDCSHLTLNKSTLRYYNHMRLEPQCDLRFCRQPDRYSAHQGERDLDVLFNVYRRRLCVRHNSETTKLTHLNIVGVEYWTTRSTSSSPLPSMSANEIEAQSTKDRAQNNCTCAWNAIHICTPGESSVVHLHHDLISLLLHATSRNSRTGYVVCYLQLFPTPEQPSISHILVNSGVTRLQLRRYPPKTHNVETSARDLRCLDLQSLLLANYLVHESQ